MKFFVLKKRISSIFGNLIILNVVLISFVLVVGILLPNKYDAIMIALFVLPFFVLFNALAFRLLRFYGSSIVFESDDVTCTFLKRVRRVIPYNEIKDYGTVWYERMKFIYISRFSLNEKQRHADVFVLYRKTKDVLVLEYHDQVIELLKTKCQNINITPTLNGDNS